MGDGAADGATLKFAFTASPTPSSASRAFEIKVTQYHCGDVMA